MTQAIVGTRHGLIGQLVANRVASVSGCVIKSYATLKPIRHGAMKLINFTSKLMSSIIINKVVRSVVHFLGGNRT